MEQFWAYFDLWPMLENFSVWLDVEQISFNVCVVKMRKNSRSLFDALAVHQAMENKTPWTVIY